MPDNLDDLDQADLQRCAALADAHPDRTDGICGSYGPGGACGRSRGHDDVATWPVNIHVSYDTDHYEDWPVGWTTRRSHVAALRDPAFGSSLTGTPEYRRGVEDAIALMHANLLHDPLLTA